MCNLGANDDDADVKVYFLNLNKKKIFVKNLLQKGLKSKKKKHGGVLGGSWVSAILSMYWMGEQVRHM